MKPSLKLALILALGAAIPAFAQTWKPDPAPAATSPSYINAAATHEAVARWLAQTVTSSRGREVFVSGGEAFWFEHQDRDARHPMHVTATIHTESFADVPTEFRSSYQVTDFDCERQTQHHVYLRRYRGPDLSGEVKEEHEILNLASFVGPTDQDYAHLRTVCLPVYDEIRKRTYSITVPAQ